MPTSEELKSEVYEIAGALDMTCDRLAFLMISLSSCVSSGISLSEREMKGYESTWGEVRRELQTRIQRLHTLGLGREQVHGLASGQGHAELREPPDLPARV